MKRLFFFLALFSSQLFFGQDVKVPSPTNVEENMIFNTAGIKVQPEFPGGLKAFYDYMASNYRIPKADIHGKVFLTFIVEKDGSITDIKILRDIGYGTGEEAVRLLKESPKWSPGELDGRKVRVQFSLPITL